MQGVPTRKTRSSPDPGNKQQPLIHGPGQIPPPGVPRRDKPQVAGNLCLHLDARDCRPQALQACKKKRMPPEPKIRTHAQGVRLPAAKANLVRRGAEGTKFGYRTGNGPLLASKHTSNPTDAASSHGSIPGPHQTGQHSPSKVMEVRGKTSSEKAKAGSNYTPSTKGGRQGRLPQPQCIELSSTSESSSSTSTSNSTTLSSTSS